MSTDASAADHDPSLNGDDVSKQNHPSRPYTLVSGGRPTGIDSTSPGWMNVSAITACGFGISSMYPFHAVDKKSTRSGLCTRRIGAMPCDVGSAVTKPSPSRACTMQSTRCGTSKRGTSEPE